MNNLAKESDRAFKQNRDPKLEKGKRNHSIQESLSLIQHKYLVTSNKRGSVKQALPAIWLRHFQKEGQR